MPSLSALKPNFNLNIPLGRRRGPDVVGLDIQPGYVAAVQAHVNGGIVVEQAAGASLPPDAVREGEVLDEGALGDALRELFQDGRLGKRVRVGLANQRTVLRTLELPPVTDRKELAAAVRFQAEDQVPMPLAGAVLDFHSLGIFETPAGPRQRVIVVAAQREMVERLLRAVRHAGLQAEGVDLSAFALIRSLYAPGAASAGEEATAERVLYLNVGGLTNMAIAEGTVCRFTRVVGGGLEAMASEVAERLGIPLVEARARIAAYDLKAAPVAMATAEPLPRAPVPVAEPAQDVPVPADPEAVETWALAQDPAGASVTPAPAASERPEIAQQPARSLDPDPQVRLVLENGIREIVGEVRNSLDFHRSQESGVEVQNVVLSGPALELRGFPEALESEFGMAVRRDSVRFADGQVATVSAHRLAIATGLATEESPR
ncbi:MAG TPA: type IV pilus assembly protein PilM [Solirubrobacteraceae bacterium]|jgi:type IV pilus assembly protein PilM|nr:type IV pilus assembly protein PilM [Solirubrobacteraceae bacterium]